ncbi:MAG: hypothetical protein H0T84_11425 [Tatlockia sp.]|nr:hypothetical protein [Tatlockia sp.]
MPYLIEGNAKQVFTTFGLDNFAQANAKNLDLIKKDIGRSPFWGTPKQGERFMDAWLNPELTASEYYIQGNLFAGNVYLGFGPIIPLPFFQPHETEADLINIQSKLRQIGFSYEDERGIPCGLTIYYRQDDPGKWIITQARNTNLSPEKHQIKQLTSFDPHPFCKKNEATISSTSIPNEEFINAIGDEGLKKFISFILDSKGKINPQSEIMNLFLQYLPLKFKNEELMLAFKNFLPEIMANKALFLLQKNKQQPSPLQILECIDENSPLSQLISNYEPIGDRIIDSRQLKILLFLDAYGLNEKQAIRSDDVFLHGLDDVLYDENLEFLAATLRDELKTKGLRFLLKTNHTREFFSQFIEVTEKANIWEKLEVLSKKDWNFPEDGFSHAVICKMICNLPTIPENKLLSLLSALTKNRVLEDFFDPISLADYLTSDGKELKSLDKVQNYFDDMLPKYKDAAAWRNLPLSPRFLSGLAEQYINKPDDKLLRELSFCSEPKDINACYILFNLGVELKLIKAYIQDPEMVYIINSLKGSGLENCIPELFEGSGSLALKQISRLKSYDQKQATLILVALKQLDPEEFFKLIEVFKKYPKLASLIVDAHEKGFSAKELKTLAFDPIMHCAANVLIHYKVDFSFKNLTPFVCQTLLFIDELSLGEKHNRLIEPYLKKTIFTTLAFFKGDLDLNEALSQLNFEEETGESLLKKKLITFIKEQMHLFTAATKFKIPEAKLLVKRIEIANALTFALQILSSLNAKDEVYSQVCAGFSNLPANAKVNEKLTRTAVRALHDCAFDTPIESLGAFDLLLKDYKLAKAIIRAAAHKLPVRQLLDYEKPVNVQLIVALNNLSRMAPENSQAFELALREDSKGHDFRLLLALVPYKTENSLIEFLQKGIEGQREKRIAIPPVSNIQNLAYQLDESLLLINRLRALNFGDEVIEFMVKEDEKSKYFYKAVRKIEADSEVIRTRLAAEHPAKFKELKVPEQEYRKDLYRAMYEGLKPDNSTQTAAEKAAILTTRIKKAENRLVKPLQMDSDECARWIAAAFVNLATIALTIVTLGAGWFLHSQHHKKTGDYFFFTSTKSEEAYKTLNSETLEETLEVMLKIN